MCLLFWFFREIKATFSEGHLARSLLPRPLIWDVTHGRDWVGPGQA